MQLLLQPPQFLSLLSAPTSQPSSAFGAIGAWQFAQPMSQAESHTPAVQLIDATCAAAHMRLHDPQL
jgi:hypothetical protein